MTIRRYSPFLGILPILASGFLTSTVQALPQPSAVLIAQAKSKGLQRVAATTTPDSEISTSSTLDSERLVGIVKSVNGSQLEIKLPDGVPKLFTAPSNFAASTLDPGSFVEVSLDEQQNIKEIKIPSVSKVLSGVISKVDTEAGQVTLELANGTQEVADVNPQTIDRMNLAPGVPLTVTSYTNLSQTKLCPTLLATCCQRPTPPLPPPSLPAELPRRVTIPQKW